MKLFAFDFETFLIQPYMQAPPAVCMSFAIDDGAPQLVHVRDEAFWRALWKALTTPGCIMVAHNAAFEITVLLAQTAGSREWRRAIFAKLKAGEFRCTLIRDRLIRIGRGIHDDGLALDACMDFHHLEHKLDKKCWWRLRYGTLINKPCDKWEPEARDYALGDTCVRELYVSQERAEYRRFLVTEHEQMEADVALALSRCWGMPTDKARAEKLLEEVKQQAEVDRLILEKHGYVKWRKKDGVFGWGKEQKKAKELVVEAYARIGKPPPRNPLTGIALTKAYATIGIEGECDTKNATDKDIDQALKAGVPMHLLQGSISLDEESCLGSRDPILKAYTGYGQAKGLQGKVQRLQFPRIQASFMVLGAVTGRTSCRMGEDPDPGEAYMAWGFQLQNPPRVEGIRDCFVADPGCAIVSIDFDTFELRTLSQQVYRLFGYSKMREVLMDPSRDVHVELGAMVYGLSSAEAYALKKTDKAKYKDLRQVAKALNFGAPGGLGPDTFVDFAHDQYQLDISRDRAGELLAIWKKMWPEMDEYLKWCGRQLAIQDPKARAEDRKAKGESTIIGEDFVAGGITFCDFANRQFQGLAACAAKRGLVALMYAMYDEEDSGIFGCRMYNFVHDEYILKIPLATLHETSHRARDIAVAAAQTKVPDVTLTASPAACIHWSKAAGDPVFNKDGKLITYEEYLTLAA